MFYLAEHVRAIPQVLHLLRHQRERLVEPELAAAANCVILHAERVGVPGSASSSSPSLLLYIVITVELIKRIIANQQSHVPDRISSLAKSLTNVHK